MSNKYFEAANIIVNISGFLVIAASIMFSIGNNSFNLAFNELEYVTNLYTYNTSVSAGMINYTVDALNQTVEVIKISNNLGTQFLILSLVSGGISILFLIKGLFEN